MNIIYLYIYYYDKVNNIPRHYVQDNNNNNVFSIDNFFVRRKIMSTSLWYKSIYLFIFTTFNSVIEVYRFERDMLIEVALNHIFFGIRKKS